MPSHENEAAQTVDSREIFVSVVVHGGSLTPLRTVCQAAPLTRANLPALITEVYYNETYYTDPYTDIRIRIRIRI